MSDDLTARDVVSQFLADYTGWWEKKSDLDTPADDFGVDADELTERLAAAGYTIVTTDDWEAVTGPLAADWYGALMERSRQDYPRRVNPRRGGGS